MRQKLLWVALALAFKSGCNVNEVNFPIKQCEDSMARNTGPIIQSNKANPGRSVVIRPDPATAVTPASLLLVPAQPGDPQGRATVMEIDGDDDESQVMTITLAGEDLRFINKVTAPLAGQARVTALVEWGVAGIQAGAFVDYVHGLSFSIPASWIRITGINEPLPLLDVQSGDQVFGRNAKVGAFCSYGSVGRSSGLSAKKSVYIDTLIPAGGSAIFPIPPFATNYVFLPESLSSNGFIVQLNDQNGTVAGVAFNAPVTSTDASPVELVGSASALRINNIGANPIWGVIVFGISI